VYRPKTKSSWLSFYWIWILNIKNQNMFTNMFTFFCKTTTTTRHVTYTYFIVRTSTFKCSEIFSDLTAEVYRIQYIPRVTVFFCSGCSASHWEYHKEIASLFLKKEEMVYNTLSFVWKPTVKNRIWKLKFMAGLIPWIKKNKKKNLFMQTRNLRV